MRRAYIEKYKSAYTFPEYEDAINEYFDFTDAETRKSLIGLNEVDQSKVLVSLTGRLYESIVNKVDDIDFGDIPYTKGDITKLNNYERMLECLDVLRDILEEYKQPTAKNIDVISAAIDNVRERKELFTRAYMMNMELPIVVYNSIVMSIVGALSLMIASCIEYIKESSMQGFETVLNKVAVGKTEQHLMFVNLSKFNKSCKSGELDKAIRFVMNNKVEELLGPTAMIAGSAIVAVGIILNIIPILRELIYFYYASKVRVSDYFAIQADLLQMNAYSLDKNKLGKSEAEVKRIVARQMAVVDSFRKISEFVKIDCKKSEAEATKEIVKDSKMRYKANEVLDSAPDSAGLF